MRSRTSRMPPLAGSLPMQLAWKISPRRRGAKFPGSGAAQEGGNHTFLPVNDSDSELFWGIYVNSISVLLELE
jgi:hypothetical protein